LNSRALTPIFFFTGSGFMSTHSGDTPYVEQPHVAQK
jgi:hypothetical protein